MFGIGSVGRGLVTVLGKFHVESEEIVLICYASLCWIIVTIISQRGVTIMAGRQELNYFQMRFVFSFKSLLSFFKV